MKLIILKREQDFAHRRFRQSVSSPNLRIRVAYSTKNNPRFGFIIPKKVMPKVTDRNKVKRRLKSLAVGALPLLKPVDVLIFPQKSALKQTFKELSAELYADFRKVGIWK